MKLKSSLLAAAVLALASTVVPSAFSAEASANMVSFQVYTLAKVRFLNLNTNKEIVFVPTVTGSIDNGDLQGFADIKIPEGIYLVRGEPHMPAELGTVCQIADRILMAKSKVDPSAVQSAAFGYVSNATGGGSFKKVCWEDFGAIGRVPDFRLK